MTDIAYVIMCACISVSSIFCSARCAHYVREWLKGESHKDITYMARIRELERDFEHAHHAARERNQKYEAAIKKLEHEYDRLYSAYIGEEDEQDDSGKKGPLVIDLSEQGGWGKA